eukprot:gene31079-6205_t
MAESSSDGHDESLVELKTPFIEDVAGYMEGKNVEAVIQEFNERYRKLKLVEQQLHQRRVRLMTKLPEIQKALDIVCLLMSKADSDEPTTLDFELAEGVFAKTTVESAQTVNLWLGAQVMVEYELPEAKELLSLNLSNCKTNLTNVNEDMDFIKDNITTTEVGIARMYNYDVERKREMKLKGPINVELTSKSPHIRMWFLNHKVASGRTQQKPWADLQTLVAGCRLPRSDYGKIKISTYTN